MFDVCMIAVVRTGHPADRAEKTRTKTSCLVGRRAFWPDDTKFSCLPDLLVKQGKTQGRHGESTRTITKKPKIQREFE